jgi:NAD(P)H-dependent flavin oxidoreductase YrpB (nitropropane dioxygenase family)
MDRSRSSHIVNLAFPDTSFARAFALRLPVVQAPMGGVAGPALVAAAANTGALGVLPIWFGTAAAAKEAIAATQRLTARPFAINLRADLAQNELIAAAAECGIGIVHLFWGNPAKSMRAIRRAGARMIATVSDADTTKAALDAGAAALIAQGVEAGGHVFGTTPLAELIPLVVAEARSVPVAAAGGIVDADDALAAFALGASAVVLGTSLVASEESDAHEDYKRALIAAGAGDTALTRCFDGFWPDAPHRTLKNSTFRTWDAAGRPRAGASSGVGARPGEGDVVARVGDAIAIPRYHAATPRAGMTGDCEAMALYAGMGVAKATEIRSAAAKIETLVRQVAAKLTSQ